MTQYEMTEKLADRMNVSLEEARAALEECGWEMLDAALKLEKEQGVQKDAYTTEKTVRTEKTAETNDEEGWRKAMKKVWNAVRELVTRGNRNRFEIRRGDEAVLELPVTVLAVLLIVALWACIIVLIAGLFFGFHYSFSGPDLGREDVNRAMEKASQTAERVKEEFAGGQTAPDPAEKSTEETDGD